MTAITTRAFDYADGDVALQGWLCLPEGLSAPAPAVLMAPAFQGVTPGMKANAEKLAATGRPVLLLDPYGVEEMARDTDPMVRMQAMTADRGVLRARLLAALDALKALPEVDAGRIAAAGYCFGGLCALDLARAAPEGLLGAASLHGVFTASPLPARKITAKVLVLHGWEDPLATPDTVLALADELTAAEADWQIHAYGRTVHAFTTPGADTPGRAMYSPDADRRSFQALGNFLDEVLDV